MYQLDGERLRVCASWLRQSQNRDALAGARLIILEHILPTTRDFVHYLRAAGADIFAVLAKPYSIDPAVLHDLQEGGFRVDRHSYGELETTDILPKLLRAAASKCMEDGRRLVLVDVGGYFAAAVQGAPPEILRHIAGIVEDTTLGHNRYLDVAALMPVPVFSVARSSLKEIEAQFVGHDAVDAVDAILRALGFSMTGRHALVIGYGMIGKNVARALRAHDLNVSVYDIRDHCNLHAFMAGFNVDKKAMLLNRADIVFAATGWSTTRALFDPGTRQSRRMAAISREDLIQHLRHCTILASVGSKDNEFDMVALRELAQRDPEEIGPHVKQYSLPDGSEVLMVKDGTAVNFLQPSIPIEVLDLVFSEILRGVLLLLTDPGRYAPRTVHEVPELHRNDIAKDWLCFANPQR